LEIDPFRLPSKKLILGNAAPKRNEIAPGSNPGWIEIFALFGLLRRRACRKPKRKPR
jgi:hypothetical protein